MRCCDMYSTPKRKPLKLERPEANSKTVKRPIICKVSCTTNLFMYLVSFASCNKPHFFTTSHAHTQTLSCSTALPLSPYSVVVSDRKLYLWKEILALFSRACFEVLKGIRTIDLVVVVAGYCKVSSLPNLSSTPGPFYLQYCKPQYLLQQCQRCQ
jgi:hypothetical protein